MRQPLAVFADLHLHEHEAFASERSGYNSRLMDARDVVLRIAEEAHKRGVKVILFLGDWNHSRRKISVACIDVSEWVIREVKKRYGIDIIAFPGNHDLSLDGKSCSVVGLPFSRVITEPGVYEIAGWKVGVIPWTDDPKAVAKVLKQKADFYAGHFGVEGARVGPSDFEMPGHIGPDTLNVTGNPILLGHYHKPQEVEGTSAIYVGSPLQLGWGETREEKRFLILTEGKRTCRIESVELADFPRFVRCKPEELDKCRPQDFVEVVVEKAKHVKRVRNKIELTRGERGANIVLLEGPGDDGPRLDLSGLNVRRQLEKYVKHVGAPPGIEPGELVKFGLQLVEHSA